MYVVQKKKKNACFSKLHENVLNQTSMENFIGCFVDTKWYRISDFRSVMIKRDVLGNRINIIPKLSNG